jgi:hypothetical protein
MRVAEKSVKRAPNLQDLLCLTVFIYIIYLPTILLRFRLPGLKSIYLLREHYTKSLAESSYSLLRGSDFSLQISLPGVIPNTGLSAALRWKPRKTRWEFLPFNGGPRICLGRESQYLALCWDVHKRWPCNWQNHFL